MSYLALTAFLFCAGPAHADNIYVADYDGTIEEFNSSGGAGSVFGSAASYGPFGLAFDSSGNLYVATYVNNTIRKFNSSGVGTTYATTGLKGPFDIAFDGSVQQVSIPGLQQMLKNTGDSTNRIALPE